VIRHLGPAQVVSILFKIFKTIFFVVLGIEFRIYHTIDKCPSTEATLQLGRPFEGWMAMVHVCNPSYWRLRLGGSRFEISLSKEFARPYLKNTQCKKRTDKVVQVIEGLPSKLEGLSSNSSITKK
jgi:hypothetical protein